MSDVEVMEAVEKLNKVQAQVRGDTKSAKMPHDETVKFFANLHPVKLGGKEKKAKADKNLNVT